MMSSGGHTVNNIGGMGIETNFRGGYNIAQNVS